jgi:hypothetical protein
MHDAQARAGGAVVEGQGHAVSFGFALDEAIPELIGEGADLTQVDARDPAAEFRDVLVHESGQDADFDALIEISAAGRKTKLQSFGKMDVVHVSLFTSRRFTALSPRDSYRLFKTPAPCGQRRDPKGSIGIYSPAGRIGLFLGNGGGTGMTIRWIGAAIAAGLMASAAHAADYSARTTRVTTVVHPERAISRLAEQGIGYSVLHEGLGVPQRGFRVHVTCTITETFTQAYCPTPQYEAYCPSATILCR